MIDIVNYQALGKRIRNKRKMMGLTQDELAKDAGISISFLGHIERGSRKASISTLLYICKALSVLPNDILHDSIGWMNPNSASTLRDTESPFAMIHALVDALEAQDAQEMLRGKRNSKKTNKA